MSEVAAEEDAEAAEVAYRTSELLPLETAGRARPAVPAEGFVHLAVHSEFSVTDGLAKVDNLAARVAELGMPAVALTDRTNLFGLVKFYAACRDAGIKAIIGTDLEYEDGDSGVHRCVVLVASPAGYRNLLRLVSSAYSADEATAGKGRSEPGAAPGEAVNGSGANAASHGRVTRQAVLDAAEGLIVLLGRASDVGSALATSTTAATNRLAHWRQAFGNRLYLEVVRTGRRDEDRFVLDAVRLAAAENVPVAATNDVRFLARDDFEAHETRVCIQEGRVLNDPRRERRYSEEQYLRKPAEMRSLFADLPEALDNTVEIAKRCSHELALGTYSLPSYPAPDGVTLEALLEQRTWEGLQRRLEALAPAKAETYRERLAYELGVINQMGFAGYFLIVQEFVTWAREQAVPVGCRGSGNASLVAYCLDITDIDPLRYDLIFERLLNPERVSMPDFDIDLCMEGRERVITHVAERYGHDAVGQIATFGTMAARLVVRDVARVQGKPFGLADRLSKMIPFEVGMTLAKAVEQEKELKDFIAHSDDAAEIMDMAYKLEGVVRNIGKHAGGVVIAPTTLTDFVPLYADQAGGTVVSQFDLHDVEDAGLVKFDFLGLKTLTIVDWAMAAVNAERAAAGQARLDVKNLPLDDAETYEFLKKAETTAIFQLESEGMKKIIRRLRPDSLDDIIALVALFRPGPLQSGAVDDYVDRKNGRSPVTYPHPLLEDVLASSYGVMLYQEQVMNIAQRLSGFSLGQADLLRRAMGKKKPAEMASMRAGFLSGAEANSVDRQLANDIFDQMEKFAGYAFNKAHAASYALLSFQTAWLKAHYPAQFMAAVLSADMQNIDKVVALVYEVERLKITMHPPDVNRSAFRFRAERTQDAKAAAEIRYGLGAVRGVGQGPVNIIVAERERGGPFRALSDFCQRVDSRRANKRLLEALIRAGAMDSFTAPDETVDAVRARLLDELPDALQGAEQVARDVQLGIDDMFGGVREPTRTAPRRTVRPLSLQERLAGEKETLGLYLTGHPIESYLDEIAHFNSMRIAQLRPGNSIQRIAGLVISHRIRRDRRDQRGDMAFTTLDDRSGRIEASISGKAFENSRAKLEKDAILMVEGKVLEDEFTGSIKLRAEHIFTMAEARRRHARGIAVHIAHDAVDGDFASRLQQVLHRHRSDRGCAVAVDYAAARAEGRVALGDAWRIDASDALLAQLREAFGTDAVAVDYGD